MRNARHRLLTRLPELMRSLYETGAYYVSVPRGEEASYEEPYWHVVRDPDGVERDRSKERAQHVGDLSAELRHLAGRQPGRILDAGCGLGHFLSALDPAWERHGLELSEYAAARANLLDGCEVRVGSVEACPYDDAFFDVVFCHHVIEHLPNPERGIRELYRVLKPGGELIVGSPDFDSGAARRFRERYRLLHDPTHITLFSSDSMHRFLRDHGLRIEQVDFPFFETRHFSEENLARLFDSKPGAVSPAFYGNFMTFYCRRPTGR